MDRGTAELLAVEAGDELAACLARFLTATADERTLERARDALALWYRMTECETLSAAV